MFGNTPKPPDNPFSGLQGLTIKSLQEQEYAQQADIDKLKQFLAQQYMSMGNMSKPSPPHPPHLSPKDAQDFLLQLEHDGVCIKDRKLLFGQHMTKDLRQVPLEYLVTLGAGVKQVRREILREIKRRRIAEKLEKS